MTSSRDTEASLDEIVEAALSAPTLSVGLVGRAFKMSQNHAYSLVRDGTFPVATVKIGSRIRVPSAKLLIALGLDPTALLMARAAQRSQLDEGLEPLPAA